MSISRSFEDDVVGDLGIWGGGTDNIKLVTVGNGGVGKTSMFAVICTNTFPTDYVPTVWGSYSSTVLWRKRHVTVGMWDTAGQSDYDRLRPLSYPQTDVFTILFSLVDRQSFIDVKEKWVPEVREHCPDVPFIIVGTKSDLLRDTKELARLKKEGFSHISKFEIVKLCTEVNAYDYFETSSLQKKNIKELFNRAIEAVLLPQIVVKKKLLFFKSKVKKSSTGKNWNDELKELKIGMEDRIKELQKELKESLSEARNLRKKYFSKLPEDVLRYILNDFVCLDITDYLEFSSRYGIFAEDIGVQVKKTKFQTFGYFKDDKRRIRFQLFYNFHLRRSADATILPLMKKYVGIKTNRYFYVFRNCYSNYIEIEEMSVSRLEFNSVLSNSFLGMERFVPKKETKGKKKKKILEKEKKVEELFSRKLKFLSKLKITIDDYLSFETSKLHCLVDLEHMRVLHLRQEYPQQTDHLKGNANFHQKFITVLNLDGVYSELLKIKTFPKLKKLRIVTHRNVRVVDQQVEEILLLKHLETLHIVNSKISYYGILFAILKEMKTMKEVVFNNCNCSFDVYGMKNFKKNESEKFSIEVIAISFDPTASIAHVPSNFLEFLKFNKVNYFLKGTKDFWKFNVNSISAIKFLNETT